MIGMYPPGETAVLVTWYSFTAGLADGFGILTGSIAAEGSTGTGGFNLGSITEWVGLRRGQEAANEVDSQLVSELRLAGNRSRSLPCLAIFMPKIIGSSPL